MKKSGLSAHSQTRKTVSWKSGVYTVRDGDTLFFIIPAVTYDAPTRMEKRLASNNKRNMSPRRKGDYLSGS